MQLFKIRFIYKLRRNDLSVTVLKYYLYVYTGGYIVVMFIYLN